MLKKQTTINKHKYISLFIPEGINNNSESQKNY